MSATGDSTTQSPTSTSDDLQPASYDGSHLPWRTFRQEVLSPHRIRVLESPPKERIPASFLSIVEAANQNSSRFDDQVTSYEAGGFGPSPLFPPNILPSIESEPCLSRCMVPSFSREALPERAINQMGPLYELSVPHPALGCGFAASAFTNKELSTIPQWLLATGTIVHFDTGYISPGATMYATFLTFERGHGNNEYRAEAANNQCAIAGAHSVRALQMLYTRAWKGQMMPELPVSFSCAIDNNVAVLNFHWIDHGQAYCMAPLCQFDLGKDVHFRKFLVWIQSINDWALSHVLPLVKQAVQRLAPQANIHATKLRLDTGVSKDEMLISSLKTTFDSIPWRFEDDEFTPVSSSTASWGSPMVSDATFSNLMYPMVHPPRSNSGSAIVARKRIGRTDPSPITPPPSYMMNQDMVLQKRLSHAMDEIRDLQQQIHVLKDEVDTSQTSLRDALATIKTTTATATSTPLDPETPKAQQLVTIPSPIEAPREAVTSTVWKCATIILSGHILASLIPSTTIRLLAYGCITNACFVAILSPQLVSTSVSKSARSRFLNAFGVSQ